MVHENRNFPRWPLTFTAEKPSIIGIAANLSLNSTLFTTLDFCSSLHLPRQIGRSLNRRIMVRAKRKYMKTNPNSRTKRAVVLVTLVCIAIISQAPVMAQNGQAYKTISTNLTGFTVPFKIDNEKGQYIEVHLYVSNDRGKNWAFYSKQDVTKSGFQFSCDCDGEYWFALKTLDRSRQFVPPGNIVTPELSIVVDTKQPKIEMSTEADAAGRVITSWKIVDGFLDPNSVKLSHRDAGGAGQWLPIPFAGRGNSNRQTYVDRIAWWPQVQSDRIEVQLEVADSAGNVASEIQAVSTRNTTFKRNQNNSTTTQQYEWTAKKRSQRTSNDQWTQKQNAVVCKDGVCTVPDSPRIAKVQPRPTNKQVTNRPSNVGRNKTPIHQVGSRAEYVDPPEPTGGFVAPKPQLAKRTPSKKPGDPLAIVWDSESSKWNGQTNERSSSTLSQNKFNVAQTEMPILGVQQSTQNVRAFKQLNQEQRSNGEPTRDFVPNQVVTQQNSQRQGDMVVSQSTAFGRGKSQNQNSSTAPKIDRHFQQNTNPQNDSRPNHSPHQQVSTPKIVQGSGNRKFIPPVNDIPADTLNINTRRFNLNYDVRAIDTSGVGRVTLWATQNGGSSWKSWATDPDNLSPFPVEVSNEGIFGFRVVINSKDGLTGKPPVSGDRPDVWVKVDLTAPKVALTSAPFGSGRDVGKLVIHWEASDAAFIERPIKLSYSPSAQGPWTTIQDRLRNTGSYAWKVPKQVPEQIFLRIEGKDTAKNVGVYQLTSPIDISGLVPRGRIYGVDPIR